MTDDALTYLRQAVARTTNGLKMLLGRGRVKLVTDTGPVQMLQVRVSAKELMDLPRLSEFGFASRPPVDSDVGIIFLNAERTWGIVVATGNQKARFKLAKDGEMAIHDAFGANGAPGKWIWAKANAAGWEIEANHEPIVINNAKGLTVNSPDGKVIFNMGGNDVQIEGAGKVYLGGKVGGKKVALDGDPVVGGFVVASSAVTYGK